MCVQRKTTGVTYREEVGNMGFHNIRGGHALRIAAEIMVSVLVFLSGEEATQRTAWYVFAGREKHDIATHGNKFNIETNIRNFIASTYIALILILIALAAVSTASAVVEYSPDSDTVILDHFNGTTSAEYVNGPLDYVNGLSGLNTAADFKQGNWIRYALPGWYSWSSIYNPEGKEGTVEMWIYPRKYGLGLLTFQWNRVNSPPGGGYILHFQINSDGKLVGGTWSAISGGPADYTLPSGKTTIPLNTWTHVAFTWGPTGTKLYVNGTIDAENPYNLYPALNSENYVYVNYWGDNDLGYIDELRISKVARTEFPTLSRNISGFKINDTNDNGIWDAGEMGIENWNINLSNATTGALIDSKSTDATGFYNFMNLTPGSYNVTEEMKTGFTATNVTSKTILIENMDVMNVNFTNALIPVIRFNITGFKINDTNGNGKWDAGEAGIQGWNITLTNVTTDAIIASNLTDNKTVDLPDEIVSLIHKFYNTLDKSERKKRKYLFDYVGRTAYRHFNHWCRVADIPERPIHALRATCIKFAHEAGWSDEAISKLTGDKIATIQEHYRTPSVDEMRQLTQKKAFV